MAIGDCHWPSGCSDRKRCERFGSCVAAAQARYFQNMGQQRGDVAPPTSNEQVAFEAWWDAEQRKSFARAYGHAEPFRDGWNSGSKRSAQEAWMARAEHHETQAPRLTHEISLCGADLACGIEHPECYTALSIGGHAAAILVVTQMEDGSKVPPYAQNVIDFLLAHSPEKTTAHGALWVCDTCGRQSDRSHITCPFINCNGTLVEGEK